MFSLMQPREIETWQLCTGHNMRTGTFSKDKGKRYMAEKEWEGEGVPGYKP